MIEAAGRLLYSDPIVSSDGQFDDIDRKRLAELSGVPRPAIRRMEASGGTVRGRVSTLTRVLQASDKAGVKLIGDGAGSFGRGPGMHLERAEALNGGSCRPDPAAQGSPGCHG